MNRDTKMQNNIMNKKPGYTDQPYKPYIQWFIIHEILIRQI